MSADMSTITISLAAVNCRIYDAEFAIKLVALEKEEPASSASNEIARSQNLSFSLSFSTIRICSSLDRIDHLEMIDRWLHAIRLLIESFITLR